MIAVIPHMCCKICEKRENLEIFKGEAASHCSAAAPSPLWRKVGRVYFHLAENKADENRPFAFLATYTTGLAPNGRPLHKPLGEALRHYSAARDKATLLRLLTPVDNAAKTLPWVEKMINSKRVYQAAPLTPGEAWVFLKDIPALKEAGLWIRIPDWWQKRPQAQVKIVLDPLRKNKMNADSFLAFDRRLVLGDEELTEAELRELLQSDGGLMLVKGRWVEVDKERLQEALDQWNRIKGEVLDGTLTFGQGMRLLAGLPGDFKNASETGNSLLRFTAGDRLGEMLSAMREAPPPKGKMAAPLAALRRRLRTYQVKGADWLSFMTSLGLGACLADDMGLGKTIQVLTMLSQIKASARGSGPSLLVLPASLLGNWRAEAQKFAPHLKLRFLHRAMDGGRDLSCLAENPQKELANCDVAVTTYAMLARQEFLAGVDWNLVIADEAQAIKNPGARQSKALKALKAKGRLALTGAPVENRLGDLWSLFDFLNPGLLGSFKDFDKYTGQLAKSGGEAAYAPLKRLINPYILRRLKTDPQVISDLPNKVESVNFCPLSKKQIALYQQAVDNLDEHLTASDGIARRGLILQTIMRLKQICNHPDQMSGAGGYAACDSGKFERLGEICAELAERQERALIFTQFDDDRLADIFGVELDLGGTENGSPKAGRLARKGAKAAAGGKTARPSSPKPAAAMDAAGVFKNPDRPKGREIAAMRRKLKMSAAEFAAALGSSVITVSRWEKLKVPEMRRKSRDKLNALAKTILNSNGRS